MGRFSFTVEGVDGVDPDEIARESVTEDPLFEPKVVEILRDYLQPDSSTSLIQATHSLVKLLPEPPEPRGWTNELSSLFVFGILAPFAAEGLEETPIPECAQHWVNVNAFYALLEQLGGGNMEHFCLWTMREAFRTSSPSSLGEAVFSCHIANAAQWIIHSGQALFHIVRFPEKTSDTPGAEQLDLDNWRLWKNGFKEAGKMEHGIKDESKQLAVKAADLMDVLERTML
ncbi:hypothetical protein IFR05_006666 [Cadophora sp. M221]|nr:hypothetical protein IFR05_006666 [Cadophora sp. M221]